MKKKKVILCTALAACLFVPCASAPKVVNAGMTGTQIEDGSVYKSDELSVTDWKFTRNSGVELVDRGGEKAINFSKSSDVGAPLMSRTPAIMSEDVEDGLKAEFTIGLNDLKGNKKFGFSFGIPRLDGDAGAKGSTYIWLSKSGEDYVYGVTFYGDEEKQLAGGVLPSVLDVKAIDIALTVTASGKLKLYCGGAEVYESADKNEVNGNGYMGFMQSGSFTDAANYIDADVTGLKILNEYYSRPQTPEVTNAKFENGEFNTEEWFLNGTAVVSGGGVFARDGLLSFENAGQNSCFLTRHKYSEFVFEYEISGAKNTPSTDASGRVVSASLWQGFEFGRDGDDAGACFATNLENSELLYFDAPINSDTGKRTGGTQLVFVHRGKYTAFIPLPEKYAFFDEEFKNVVGVRVSVIEGKLAVGLKLKDEFKYDTVYEYEFENKYTPVGFMGLRGEGNQFVANRTILQGSTFSFGNISVVNYDKKPNIVEVGFTSNILPKIGDYQYIDTWTDDYLVSFTGGKGTKKFD